MHHPAAHGQAAGERRAAFAPHTSLFLPMLVLGLLAAGARAQEPGCDLETLGVAPLCDLVGEYAPGVPGGLYPGGATTRPALHEQAGIYYAREQVMARDAEGNPNPKGLIGMISIGMSNTTQEFDAGPWTFKPRADADPAKNPNLVIVDGAQPAQDAHDWSQPGSVPWLVLESRLAAAGVSPAQVQVVWMKQAISEQGGLGFPLYAQTLHQYQRNIIQILADEYPNVRLVYVSSRTRSWELGPWGTNPEPIAYESAFSVRWLMQDQLGGDPALTHGGKEPAAPWLSWGPYLWADGNTPRSDGLVWPDTDLIWDCTHPSITGEAKVASQLLAFFKTDPTTTPWFLRDAIVGEAPQVAVSPSATGGPAPVTVTFAASGRDPDGKIQELAWTFDDGTSAFGATASKTFHVPGKYNVRLAATDDDGNVAHVATQVVVGGGPWINLGSGTSGSDEAPLLVADGSLQAGDTITLTHLNLPPASTATIVFGHSAVNVPFKGGVLVPDPMLAIDGISTGDGELTLAGRWPDDVPSGLPIVAQTWIEDRSAPAGFAATNGVMGVAP